MTTSNKIEQADLDKLVKASEVTYTVIFEKVTVCAVKLPSDFVVIGVSACVDKDNFDQELGEKYSLEDAVSKLWELEGYRLADAIQASKEQPQKTYIERMEEEYAELKNKHEKLVAFINEGQPDNIDNHSWALLEEQEYQMSDYAKTLKKRIILAKRNQDTGE